MDGDLETPPEQVNVDTRDFDQALEALPSVVLAQDLVPDDLQPATFLAEMITRVFTATPINMHRVAP